MIDRVTVAATCGHVLQRVVRIRRLTLLKKLGVLCLPGLWQDTLSTIKGKLDRLLCVPSPPVEKEH